MSLSFKSAKDLQLPWIHTFLYGDTGAGKTHAAATWPRPIFIVPANEGSIVTLRGRDIPYYEVTGIKERLSGGVGGLIPVIDELEHAYHRDPDNFPFDTIVVESLSHYSDLAVEEISNAKGEMDRGRWGQLSAHFRNIQARLRNMEVHAVFTALARVDKGEDGSIIGEPLIPGATARKLPSACDIIGYCEETGFGKSRKRRVYFRRHKHFAARSRFPELPDSIDNLSFQEIDDLLRGTKNHTQEDGNNASNHTEK